MELESHDVTQLGVYELQIVGIQKNSFDPTYERKVTYKKITVEIYDPCSISYFVPSEKFSPDKPDDITDFLLDGTDRFTYHKQFSDNVTEIFYDIGNPDHEYPLCGVPIGYKVLAPDDTDLPLNCVAEHDLGTFDVTVTCNSLDESLDGQVIEAKIVAYNATAKDPETNVGESQSFFIYCVKPTEDNPFAIKDSAPVFDVFPENFDLDLDTDSLDSLSFSISISDSTNDLKLVKGSYGKLASFITEEWSSLGSGKLTFNPTKKLPIGDHSISFEAEDSAGNKTKKVWTISVKGNEADSGS